MKLVKIDWLDACSKDEWHDVKDCLTAAVACTTIGFVVFENKQAITLAPTITELDTVCCTMTIPKGWITNKTEIVL